MDLRETAETILSSTPSIDFDAVAETTLFTCPAGKSCIVTKVVLRLATGAGLPMGTMECSFGWNTANADDVIANAARVLTAATNYLILVAAGDAEIGLTTETFKIDVQVAEGAALTGTVEVFGFIF